MNESIISVRYTKAIFKLAVEKNSLETVKADMEQVYAVMAESEALKSIFQNPVLKPSKKIDIIKQIFEGFHPLSLSFIELLITNRREIYLQDITRNFLDKYRQHKGIEPAVLITAIKADNTILAKVDQLLHNGLKKEIELSNQVDDKIIGGFILRIGDNQYDASVRSGLDKIKRRLINTSIH